MERGEKQIKSFLREVLALPSQKQLDLHRFFKLSTSIWRLRASQVAQQVKNLPTMLDMQEMWLRSLGQEDPLEEGMATDSSILAWRIPWTEELGGLQSKGSQRVRHDWSNWAWTKYRRFHKYWIGHFKTRTYQHIFFLTHVKEEAHYKNDSSKVRSAVKETECKHSKNSHDKGKLIIESENED